MKAKRKHTQPSLRDVAAVPGMLWITGILYLILNLMKS